MKNLSLEKYVNEYHAGNKSAAARSLTLVSTCETLAKQAIGTLIKRNDHLVNVNGDVHMLCKIVAHN